MRACLFAMGYVVSGAIAIAFAEDFGFQRPESG